MIDPKLLTKEFGFEDCVVVETVSKIEIPGWGILVWIYPRFNQATIEDIGKHPDIISAKPLTGPMAIWNFAPKWAEVCFHSDMGSIHFYTQAQLEQYGDMVFDPEHDKETVRPWWAK